MREIIFKPKYNWASIVFLGFLLTSLGGAFAWGGFVIDNLFLIIFGLLFVMVGVGSVIAHSKMIIIRDGEVVMKRLLFPDLVFKLENFSDFNDGMFMFGKRAIHLQGMTNSQEFVKIFSKFLEERNIKPTGNYVADVKRTNKALKYSFVPSVILTFIVTYLIKVNLGIQIDAGISFLVIFLIALFGVYFILKRREEME